MTLILLVLAASPVTVAAPAFQVSGLDERLAGGLFDRFVTQLSASGRVTVTSSKDIERVLGMERQQQLLGCTDANASCLAELAGALGAEAVLSGSVLKLGTGFTITLRLVAGRNGSELAAATHRAKDIDAVQDWLDEQAPLLVAKLVATMRPDQPGETVTPRYPSSLPWILLGSAAALVAVTGVGLFVAGKADYAELKNPNLVDLERIEKLGREGPVKQQAGVGLMIAGGVVLAGAVTWAILQPSESKSVGVGVLVTPNGAFAGLHGSLP